MSNFLRLKPGRHNRVIDGHPWVFAGEIIPPAPGQFRDGDAVELRDPKDRCLGSGLYNSKSQIVWRRFARAPRPFDELTVHGLLDAALARRDKNARVQRLVWSESDNLPGLVVERFDDCASVQSTTCGMDRMLPAVAGWLQIRLGIKDIVFRCDAPSRKYEGLESYVKTWDGKPFRPRPVEIDGITYTIDLVGGQKTGYYLDQREQHSRVARLAKDRKVLDACCNQGGFALQAAKAGAASVLAIDISEDCTGATAANAAANGLAVDTLTANIFDWFTTNRETKFDLIILDPPPFARTKESVEGALRGYKELNLRAMRLLTPGGILATYSCSQRVSVDDYLAVLGDAAADARREARLIEITGQPADHPVLLTFPESRYLKGAIIRVD